MFVTFLLFSRGRSWAVKVFDLQDGIVARFGLSTNEKKVMRTVEKLKPSRGNEISRPMLQALVASPSHTLCFFFLPRCCG